MLKVDFTIFTRVPANPACRHCAHPQRHLNFSGLSQGKVRAHTGPAAKLYRKPIHLIFLAFSTATSNLSVSENSILLLLYRWYVYDTYIHTGYMTCNRMYTGLTFYILFFG
jgi:hypothetical protein